MIKFLLVILLSHLSLHAIPPSPHILKDVRENHFPPAFSIAFTEPAGRNLVPGQFFFPGPREKLLVVLVEFSDQKLSAYSPLNNSYGSELDKNYFARLIFGGDYAGFNKNIVYSQTYNSVKRYFKEISYNQCELTGNITQVTLNKKKKYYAHDSLMEVDNGNISYSRIIIDAVLQLQEQGIDISSYDYDQDGYLDHVIVIAAASNQSAYLQTKKVKNNYIWPKRVLFTDNTASLRNGKKLGWGIIVTFDSPVGIIAHELMHELGASDLHDPDRGYPALKDSNDYPVSFWGLMDMGAWSYRPGEFPGECPAHPLGFYKWKMGWIEPEIISKSRTIKIKAIENNKKDCLYKINTGKGDYFLIENRNPFSYNTFYDKSFLGNLFPIDSGLIITHVDESIILNYNENYYTINWGSPEYAHYAVRILDGRPFHNNRYDERKIDAAFSKEDLQTELTPYSSYANTLSYYSENPYISIRKISKSGKTMKAYVSIKELSKKDYIRLKEFSSFLNTDILNISFKAGMSFKKGEIKLLSPSGKRIFVKNVKIKKGSNDLKIKIPSNIEDGVYPVQVTGYSGSKKKSLSNKVQLIIMRKQE